MKKIGAGIGVLGMIIILIKIVSDAKDKKAASVNIIGGADGPTSIFLAGKVGGTSAVIGTITGIVLLSVVIFIIARRK